MKQTEKFFITKYALTGGIDELRLEMEAGSQYAYNHDGYWAQFVIGKTCHRTREEAVARAEQMRAAKIASLEKQIAKLRKKTFS